MSESGKYKAVTIANWFINKQNNHKTDGGEDSKYDLPPLDQFRLIKLVYVAHGYYLAMENKPLIEEKVLPWRYGPVIKEIYDEIKKYAYKEIDNPIVIEGSEEISGEDNDWLNDKIWQKYKWHAGTELSMLTHEQGTPWSCAASEGEETIPNAWMKILYDFKRKHLDDPRL